MAGVATQKKKGDDESDAQSAPSDVILDSEEQGEETEDLRESQKSKLDERRKAQKTRQIEAQEAYQQSGSDDKLKAFEDQQALIRLLKYELKRQEVAINEALAQGAHVNACTYFAQAGAAA